MIRAIGLAANKLAFCDETPFTLKIKDNYLIDLQISTLRNSGIEDIEYVIGYKGEKFSQVEITTHFNKHWDSSSATDSLRIALNRSELSNIDLLLFYGDTIFELDVIQNILRSKNDFTVCVALQKEENDYKEWCFLSNGQLAKVSDFTFNSFSVFTGIIYIKSSKISYLMSKLNQSQSYPELLNNMIADGENISVHIINQGWMELRTVNSLNMLLRKESWLAKLIQIHTDWTSRSVKYNELDWVNRDVLLKCIGEICFQQKPRTCIDLGTGTGKVLKYIRQIVPKCECWGVDYSASMLSKVENKEYYKLIMANINDLSILPPEYFDLTTARMVFHHVPNIPEAIAEVLRILKIGGLFLICEGNPPSIRTMDWYTEMFRYKEDRHTLTEIDLINFFIRSGRFIDIQTKSIIMRDCSLNNWLNNSGLPEQNIRIIKEMHCNAPDYVKQDYNMKLTEDDCLMDWKFSITYATKCT